MTTKDFQDTSTVKPMVVKVPSARPPNFYVQLRNLWMRAGQPSPNSLMEPTGLSHPTIQGCLEGTVRPRRETAIQIVNALCGGDSGAFREAMRQYDIESREIR